MTISTSARSALRLPYLAVRTPLGLLDDQVVCRVLGADSPVHRTLARGLATLDHLAAATLTPTHHTDRNETDQDGSDEENSPVEDSAANLFNDEDEDEDEVLQGPTDVIPAAPAPERPEPEPIAAEEQREIVELAEGYLAAEELETHVGELAENDELRRVQAEIKAKQDIEDAHGQL